MWRRRRVRGSNAKNVHSVDDDDSSPDTLVVVAFKSPNDVNFNAVRVEGNKRSIVNSNAMKEVGNIGNMDVSVLLVSLRKFTHKSIQLGMIGRRLLLWIVISVATDAIIEKKGSGSVTP
jgi:hypothetical protein